MASRGEHAHQQRGQALLVLAMEAASLNEVPEAGQQMAFTRVRIRVDNLVAGETSTITHPFGVETVQATGAVERSINLTRDIGCIGAPCDSGLALGDSFGPFLRWDRPSRRLPPRATSGTRPSPIA